MKLLNYFLLVLLICSCRNSKKESHVSHPTEENLSLGKFSNNTIKSDIINENKDKFNHASILTSLKQMSDKTKIGKDYGAEEEIFGRIESIRIDSLGRIYILDVTKQEVSIFDSNGEFISKIGGKGQGPGEYERATSIDIYKNKLLFVGNGFRIEVYDISGPKAQFIKTVQINKQIRNFCVLKDKLFIHNILLLDEGSIESEGLPSVNTVHAYQLPTFEPLYSFGKPYKSNNPMVVERMSLGDISCNRSAETVLFAFERLPMLYGYSSTNGEVKWKTRINDLYHSEVIETNEGGRTRLTYMVSENKIKDFVYPSVSVKNQYEVLQIHRSILAEDKYNSENLVLTFLLNSSNGKGELVSKIIPSISDINQKLVATTSSDLTSVLIFNINN